MKAKKKQVAYWVAYGFGSVCAKCKTLAGAKKALAKCEFADSAKHSIYKVERVG